MINKLVRVLGLGLMIATFAFAGLAQDRTRDVVYKQYTDNFESKDPAKIQLALDAAKEYVSKFNTPDDKAQVDYFNSAIPTLEKSITDLKKGAEDAAAKKAESDAWYALLGKVEAANKAKNWAELYTAGKQAIDKPIQYLDAATIKSQKLDLAIILGVAGFDRAFTDKVDTYNADALTYLKSAIQQIEAGQTSKTFGLLGYELNNKDNALGLMNYYAGYINFYRLKNKEAALPYFYKATQYNSAAKGFPAVYENIGAKFYDKIAELDPKRLALIQATPDKQDTPETIAMLAEERGNAERGIEAYSKALKAAQADAKVSQQYKDGLRATLEQLYKFRMNLKEGEKVEGLDAYINTAAAKPLTNPADAVKPIVVEEPAPTTETTPASTTSTTPTTTPATKPATTPATTTPAATTPATKPAAASTATKPAATATKPATTAPKTTTPKKPRKR